jgi:ABC-type glycerol-3-phosphate transport system permease component
MSRVEGVSSAAAVAPTASAHPAASRRELAGVSSSVLRLRRLRRLRTVAWYVLNCALAALFILPLLSALSVALTSPGHLFSGGISTVIPLHPSLVNFRQAWDSVPFLSWYENSLKVAVLFTVGQLVSTSLTAYALAKLRFFGRKVLMVVVVTTLMIPFQAIMIPLFELMKDLHWINTLYPLWVPAFFGDTTGAFGIFIMRQAFLSVPNSLSEAAQIEGAGHGKIFLRIFLPLAAPQLAVVAVFSFLNSWNDFARPIIYLTGQSTMTVTGGLASFATAYNVQWGPLMAGTLLSIVPTLVVYVCAQRFFRPSLMGAGLRG